MKRNKTWFIFYLFYFFIPDFERWTNCSKFWFSVTSTCNRYIFRIRSSCSLHNCFSSSNSVCFRLFFSIKFLFMFHIFLIFFFRGWFLVIGWKVIQTFQLKMLSKLQIWDHWCCKIFWMQWMKWRQLANPQMNIMHKHKGIYFSFSFFSLKIEKYFSQWKKKRSRTYGKHKQYKYQ